MADHALRALLNNEIHARSSSPIVAPARVSLLAYTITKTDPDPLVNIAFLAEAVGETLPEPGSFHHTIRFENTSVRFERHGEFYRLSIRTIDATDTGDAIHDLPSAWITSLPGSRLVAIHTQVLTKEAEGTESVVQNTFGRNDAAASTVGQGQATIWTDFQIREDGFTRVLIKDNGMSPMRLGRLVRRIHEIETYRMMALLTLPVARELQPRLDELETSLLQAVEIMNGSANTSEDSALLDKITSVARETERLNNGSSYRFSASRAYSTLVRQRIEELNEERVPNHQRIGIFLERRFGPAMATCAAVSDRLKALAKRCERAGNLLRTRVDIALENQNQHLLTSMETRTRQSLLLQETVEGLSVVAVSYYALGIVFKIVESAGKLVPWMENDLFKIGLIPCIVIMVWLLIKKSKRNIFKRRIASNAFEGP